MVRVTKLRSPDDYDFLFWSDAPKTVRKYSRTFGAKIKPVENPRFLTTED